MRGRPSVFACLWLLLLPGVANGKNRPAARLMRAFCTELEYAGKIFAEGTGAEKKLRACVFDKERKLRACTRVLGVDRRVLRYVRKNSAYFDISGDPLAGYVLQVNRRRFDEIKKRAPRSPYTELIEVRLRIQALMHELGTKKAPGEIPAHLRDDKEQSAATSAELAAAQKRYLELLTPRIAQERDDSVERCLLREQERFSRLTTTSGQGP